MSNRGNKPSQSPQQVEESPDKRYTRFDKRLGKGAYKDVWLAFDNETGKEVAWNTVDLTRMPNQSDRKRIALETQILKELHHSHIINFHDVWHNLEKEQICFITELLVSGTLKEYTGRLPRPLKIKVLKKWCRQILSALDYLHSHNPPIIHRDLKCDNIFINGNTGEIRIGDFGLSVSKTETHAQSVLGTPQFMAPELYDEKYTEKVDIYSFGMCVLEMVTKEYPYEECANAVQIWRKVSAGQKPAVITRILNTQVRSFIDLCLQPEHLRLSARELLDHPFLAFKSSDPREDSQIELTEKPAGDTPNCEEVKPSQTAPEALKSPTGENRTLNQGDKTHVGAPGGPSLNNNNNNNNNANQTNGHGAEPPQKGPPVNDGHAAGNAPGQGQGQPAVSERPSDKQPAPSDQTRPVSVAEVSQHVIGCEAEAESFDAEGCKLIFSMHYERRRKKQVKFEFKMATDTPETIAGEMVEKLRLPDPERTAQMIATTIQHAVDPVRRGLPPAHVHFLLKMEDGRPCLVGGPVKPETQSSSQPPLGVITAPTTSQSVLIPIDPQQLAQLGIASQPGVVFFRDSVTGAITAHIIATDTRVPVVSAPAVRTQAIPDKTQTVGVQPPQTPHNGHGATEFKETASATTSNAMGSINGSQHVGTSAMIGTTLSINPGAASLGPIDYYATNSTSPTGASSVAYSQYSRSSSGDPVGLPLRQPEIPTNARSPTGNTSPESSINGGQGAPGHGNGNGNGTAGNGMLHGTAGLSPTNGLDVHSPALSPLDRSPVQDTRVIQNRPPGQGPVHASDVTFSSVRGTQSTRSHTETNGMAHSVSAAQLAIPEGHESDDDEDEAKLKGNKSLTAADSKALLAKQKLYEQKKAQKEAIRAEKERKKKEEAEKAAAKLEQMITLAGTKL